MAQLQAAETHDLTVAVQDYAKAVYALEARDGSASTNELAAMLAGR